MKYHIVEEDGFCFIKVSGETRKNEAVMARGGAVSLSQGKRY